MGLMPPTVAIRRPQDGAVIEVRSSEGIIPVVAEAVDPDGSVEEVRFFIEYRTQNELRHTSPRDDRSKDGWEWSWNWRDSQHPYSEGQYTIRAYAIDNEGTLAFSPTITITVRNVP